MEEFQLKFLPMKFKNYTSPLEAAITPKQNDVV
jgi:hypothetical protein